MENALGLASDVISGGASFAGLILVYLGAIAAGYDSYETQQKPSVREDYRKRGWLGCTGILISIGAAGFGLVGKWAACGAIVAVGALLLLLALAWGVWTAIATVRGIS